MPRFAVVALHGANYYHEKEQLDSRKDKLVIEISTPALAVNQATTRLFYYRNVTSQVQIIRLDRVTSEQLEKVVFPGEQLLFHSTAEAFLEVCTNKAPSFTLIEQIPCSQLQVIEKEP